jgi:hypothetical protein
MRLFKRKRKEESALPSVHYGWEFMRDRVRWITVFGNAEAPGYVVARRADQSNPSLLFFLDSPSKKEIEAAWLVRVAMEGKR